MIRLISLLPIPKFINEQPEWWTDMSVDQQKQYLSTYKKSKHKIVPQNPSGKEERGKNVVKTKPYSRQQAQDETGEYFENDVAYEAMPNLAKDEDELVEKILNAKEETFSSESGVDGRMKIGKTNVKELV